MVKLSLTTSNREPAVSTNNPGAQMVYEYSSKQAKQSIKPNLAKQQADTQYR